VDKLDKIFTMQQDLDSYMDRKRSFKSKYTPEEWVQKKSLALIDEVGELLDEVNYKWWKNPKTLDKQAISEELVDILHFWVSMCLDMGLTAEDIYKVYKKKNQDNKDRQTGKIIKDGYCCKNGNSN